MKLKLTIQEMKDRETLAMFKVLSGTLEVTLPDKDKKGKNKVESINFMSTVKDIPGLENIVENLIVNALELKQQSKK